MGTETAARRAPRDEPPGRGPSAAERVGRALPTVNPLGAVALTALGAFLVLTAAMVLVGHIVTSLGRARWDAVGINRWFANGRSAPLDDLSALGSRLAETLTVVALAVLVVAILGARRRFVDAGVIAIGLLIEVTAFVTTTLLVERARPDVTQMDAAPPTSSFPSGHTAAAVVLYVGLAAIVYRSSRRGLLRTIAVAVLVAVPVAVGLARLYRGMHHPTDVIAGILLGFAALAAAAFAVRVGTTTAIRGDSRERDLTPDEARPRTPTEVAG